MPSTLPTISLRGPRLGGLVLTSLVLGGCAGLPAWVPGSSAPPAAPPAEPAPVFDRSVRSVDAQAEPETVPPPAPPAAKAEVAIAPPAPPPTFRSLPPPRTPRSSQDLRRQAAERLVAASPGRSYTGAPPSILFGIPVLKVELHADGRVRHIEVMRRPSNPKARDTVDLAIEAVHRAAPYGDVARLPKPWVFSESFLFDEQRRFKPMTLDR